MISAMNSGSGKTIVSCALMRAFARRGMTVAGAKCGPDYIDPMFHTRVLGVPSRNLDLFLQGEAGVRQTLSRIQGDILIMEGAMGFYDGINGTDASSAWNVAEVTGTPVILVLKPRGQSLTLAAQVCGMLAFRKPSRIAGLFLTDTRPSLYSHLKPILEQETGLPVLGFLPPMEQAVIESRHLGLVTAAEIADLNARFDVISEELAKNTDLDWMIAIAGNEPWIVTAGYDSLSEISGNDSLTEFAHLDENSHRAGSMTEAWKKTEEGQNTLLSDSSARKDLPGTDAEGRKLCRIAVARDEAFCFYYQDNLDILAFAGAELVYFSPLRDEILPAADGLYLGGGYPELYLKELSENIKMRQNIYNAVQRGMPVVAECGGFLYLNQSVGEWPMTGVLPGEGFNSGRLKRFGYLSLQAEKDSLLFRAGEKIPAHEFHYYDSSCCGQDLLAEKPDGRSWPCGYATDTMYAGFPHLHFGGKTPMAERFVRAAAAYRKSH